MSPVPCTFGISRPSPHRGAGSLAILSGLLTLISLGVLVPMAVMSMPPVGVPQTASLL